MVDYYPLTKKEAQKLVEIYFYGLSEADFEEKERLDKIINKNKDFFD